MADKRPDELLQAKPNELLQTMPPGAMLAQNAAGHGWTDETPALHGRHPGLVQGDLDVTMLQNLDPGWCCIWSHPYAQKIRRKRSKGTPDLAHLAAKTVARNLYGDKDNILESLHPKMVMHVWNAIDNPRNLSLRQWKAIHTALKEYHPEQVAKRQSLLGKRKRDLMSDEAEEKDAWNKPDEPQQAPPEPSPTKIENWHVISALVVLESSAKIEEHKAQDRTVKLLVAEVEGQITRAIKRDREQVFHHYAQQIDIPVQTFSAYIEPLSPSGAFDFITHLRIAGPFCKFTQQELAVLPGLQNLGVLEVIEPRDEGSAFPRVTDDMLRSWSLTKDPFPKLAVFRVHSQQDLTLRSLQYVAQYPLVMHLRIWGKDRDWKIDDQDPRWGLEGTRNLKFEYAIFNLIPSCVRWGHLAHCRFHNIDAANTPECQGAVPVISLGLGLDIPSWETRPLQVGGEEERWLVFNRRATPP